MAKLCPNCELTYSDAEFFCAADGSPLRSAGADADNLVGTIIADRYRVESILGEGGMGRVYRARHVRVPREAAIKVLRRALIADDYAVAAFNREARNAASLGDHPNVAAVYDFGETADGLVFLAMEYVDGETLTRRLEREPVLPPRRAVEIVRQIASGLTAAHELPEPIVHRDLKPDNILLKATRDGSDWVKIVDFGIAKAIKRDTQVLTTPGLVVGTPRFMAPEQLTGANVDVRADVYALAIMAFRMLTGRMPFASAAREEESTIQWALQRLTQAPLPLRDVYSGVEWPAGVQAVFDQALQRDPNQRTPSAAEFARALSRAFGFGTPAGVMSVVSPEAPTALMPQPNDAARTRAISPAPAGSATVAGEPTVARERPQRRFAVLGAAAVLVVGVVGVFLWSRRPTEPIAPAVTQATPNDSSPQPQPMAATTSPAGRSPAPTADKSIASRPITAPSRAAPSDSFAAPKEVGGTSRSRDTSAATSPDQPVVRPRASRETRATLDELKSAVADPDAVAAAGNGAAILARIDRLLPALTTRADSVEATYYAVEVNLILDKPGVACRLLNQIRSTSQGTPYKVSVDRYLADTELACASRP